MCVYSWIKPGKNTNEELKKDKKTINQKKHVKIGFVDQATLEKKKKIYRNLISFLYDSKYHTIS